MYYIPIVLTIVANVFYHITQRYTSEKINPFFSLSITYIVAFVVSTIMYLVTRKNVTVLGELRCINSATPLLGICIVFLELGFLLAYRAGWNVGTASIISTVMVTIVLVPIGLFVFRESISMKNIAGIILCILGIILLNNK
jgi:multidrug transporter EmrE-like cation transporter